MTKQEVACSTCRAPIKPEAQHYRCSVSSCNAGRLKMQFCSVACWESHVPTARHRKAECIVVEGSAL